MELKNSFESFVQPAEWAPHDFCWLGWPSAEELWKESLPDTQKEFVQLCRAIVDQDPITGQFRGEPLRILVRDSKGMKQAQMALAGLPVQFYQKYFGDIWLRDTAPIFVQNQNQNLKHSSVALTFAFNGWGQKYILEGDNEVSRFVAENAGVQIHGVDDFIFEGGSIDTDGLGTFLTTEQCLLNPNRNPQLSRDQVEQKLKILGAKKVIWLGDGLINDHTDGHIDTIARFIAPQKVVCMRAENPKEDPNTEILLKIENKLKSSKDAMGKQLEVHTIPSPGLILNEEGDVMPASYVNFYMSNTSVIVPLYGSIYDESALQAIQKLFPERKAIGLSAKAILSGGGAFHCITQQQPSLL